MKKIRTIFVLALVALGAAAMAQTNAGRYTVVFYNQENLFDTIKSPGVDDEEFTPTGAKQWNSARYWKKIDNMTEVFYRIAAEQKAYPAVIGLAEVENRNVIEDLVGNKKLLKANYQIVHYQSPDKRGVSTALLYRPDQFKLEGSEPIRFTLPNQPDFRSRDVLMVWGRIEGELFYFFVNHWPSRLGGQKASEYKRQAAATLVRNAVDSVYKLHPDVKVVIMGDLNDDPVDPSMTISLGAKGNPKDVGPGDLFNPFYEMFKKGFGTLAYQDTWNLFDNMIVNYNLLNSPQGQLRLQKTGKFYGNIFNRSFLTQTSGQYKGYPLRTFVGNTFQEGYSDHFPVYLIIGR